MVRSMYSGVAGMKAHQTRMDVIGNNIANVNTYGFKSSRATFRDMYYQSIRGAAAGTDTRGGINPSSIGYGSSIGSVDLLMTQSAMGSTGNPLDVAITGEGFFQVMDNDGNIFYTKAGMLDIDSNGNLIDTNGYFVLGTSGNPLGQAAGSNKIQFQIPNVPPNVAKTEENVYGMKFSIEATNQTREGNVSFRFASGNNLPIGQDVEVIFDGSSIAVRLNPNAQFTSLADLETKVNNAITAANGGVAHPAGNFKFTMDPASNFPTGGLTGAEIVNQNTGYNKGTLDAPAGLFGGWQVKDVGNKFSGSGAATYTLTHNGIVPPATEDSVTISVVIGGTTYSADILQSQMSSPNNVILKNTTAGADPEDSITMSFPRWSTMEAASDTPGAPTLTWTTGGPFTGTATQSTPSRNLGLSGPTFKLEGGTEGGAQTIKDLTGITIGADGTVVASHGVHGRLMIGRIDIATFDNPRGLIQSGNSYFAETLNSGAASITIAGENGSGALKNSALELSNVDLSQEFSDMIVTQRGFQANSRLITVSDTMLEELINLKR